MSWLLMNTGREHQLRAPPTLPHLAARIDEIGHSLAQINRYTGHAARPYSVAEHSTLCSSIAAYLNGTYLQQLLCLMHDAHESITGDVASPTKEMLGDVWRTFEDAQQDALLTSYELLDAFNEHRAFIKHCDLIALAIERRDLMGFKVGTHTPWPVLDTPGQEVHALPAFDLNANWRQPLTWLHWANEFTSEYHLLRNLIAAQP
jgi:hypothetical protein